VAIKRRIEVRTHTHRVVRIYRCDAVLKGWCAKCGQEVEVTQVEPPAAHPPRKPK